jgi:dipeptidyl aminopeptidase/acylaminoacyl peptidase
VAFVASTPAVPSELFVCDLATGTERQLTSFNAAWQSRTTLSVPERCVIQPAPGVEVDVWFMKPADYQEGTSYPVLLNIHGGPFTQYGERFFDEFHVYTGAGYGVVFCNPRGSSGQSTAFGRSIIGNMGGDDFHDVMAAFDAALARMPWADRSRLGIMGGSYGGFMTSWVIGHDSRFAAAISERAVNCWYTMQGTSDIGPSFNESYLGERAVIEADVAAVLRQSPLTYAKDIRTPVLILHSEDDLRCPISQAEQLFVVLKRLGKEVEFVRFPDENHELSRAGKPSHRIDRFAVILDYVARKLAAPVHVQG